MKKKLNKIILKLKINISQKKIKKLMKKQEKINIYKIK